MSSTQLFRVSGISLLLSALLRLIDALLTFFVNLSLTASPDTFQSPLWSTYYSLSFTSVALILIGLPAFYLRLRGQRGDRWGFFGLLFILVGTFLLLGMAGYFVSVLPVVASKAPQILTAIFESGFAIFPLGGTLFLTIGTILLGIAVLRAKVFPALVGILLLASAILILLGPVFQSGLLGTLLVPFLSAIASAAAYGWVGMMLVQQAGVSGAAAYQPQTALR
jgi:hypothetical protein